MHVARWMLPFHAASCTVYAVRCMQPVGYSSRQTRSQCEPRQPVVPSRTPARSQARTASLRSTAPYIRPPVRIGTHASTHSVFARARECASTDHCREAIEWVHEHQHDDKHAAHEHHRRKAALSVTVKSRAIQFTDLAKLKCSPKKGTCSKLAELCIARTSLRFCSAHLGNRCAAVCATVWCSADLSALSLSAPTIRLRTPNAPEST